MKSNPFIAHSDVTGRIYIISGKEKCDVTDQVIKAMEDTGRMKGELWIPTKEKPPEDFEHVYAQTIYGEHVITQYIPPRVRSKNHPDGYWGEIDCLEYDYFDVVAWRHLPESYRSGLSEWENQ